LGRNSGGGDCGAAYLGVAKTLDVVPHRERAQADLTPGVRLAEMTSVVPHDVPVDAVLFDVIDQQRLRRMRSRPLRLRSTSAAAASQPDRASSAAAARPGA